MNKLNEDFSYGFLAVHGIEPESSIFFGQGLQRVDVDGSVLGRYVEAEALLNRLGHPARARLDLHRVRGRL